MRRTSRHPRQAPAKHRIRQTEPSGGPAAACGGDQVAREELHDMDNLPELTLAKAGTQLAQGAVA